MRQTTCECAVKANGMRFYPCCVGIYFSGKHGVLDLIYFKILITFSGKVLMFKTIC
jgi:hypothetical protein